MSDKHTELPGICPACGGGRIFLAEGGWPTCPYINCPNPTLVADILSDGPQALFDHLATTMRRDSERWFPALHTGPTDLGTFYALGLIGEAGEVANVVKKRLRIDPRLPEDEHEAKHQELRDDLAAELADVFTYLMLLAHHLGFDLHDSYTAKRLFNEKRWGAAARKATTT